MTRAARLLLALALQALAGSAAAQDAAPGWTRLDLPSLARAPLPSMGPARLLDGRHLRADGVDEDDRPDEPHAGFHVRQAVLADLLELDARLGGDTLRVLRPAPPLVAGGSRSALDRARDVCAELDTAGRALDLELSVWLVPGAAEDGAARLDAPPASPPTYSRRVRPGQEVTFGSRSELAWLASYSAEVSNGTEIADPVFGSAVRGRTVHARAWRVDGGRAVLVEGLLDLAEVAFDEAFDPDSYDMGTLERPSVASLQVTFSGRIASGGALRAVVRNAPLAQPDWTLIVSARTRPDPPRAAVSWAVADVAVLEDDVEALELPHPGYGFGTVPGFDDVGVLAESRSSSAIWGHVAALQPIDAEPLDVSVSPGFLIAPAGLEDFWIATDLLVRAAEEARSRTVLVDLQHGELRCSLPVAGPFTARVLAQLERPLVVDYETEVATEASLAVPRVEVLADGVLLQGHLAGDELLLTTWSAASAPVRTLDGHATGQGRTELPERFVRAGSHRVTIGEQRALAPATSELAALTVGVQGTLD